MKKYFVPLFFALLGCGEHSFEEIIENAFGMGLVDPPNMAVIPEDVKNFSEPSSLPASVSLEDKFPPVQSQGQYGTCSVWSVGYAFKTALNAIDKNWSASDLEKTSNQTSPKDLWISVPSSRRSATCNGVAMEYAMDALIVGGAASMADVPYDMSSSCNASNSQARGNPNNKLANYRKIAYNQKLCMTSGNKVEGMTVENFKNYLAQGRPIPFAAVLGDRFRSWRSRVVLSSDYNTRFGHAMVLVGYDDSKQAFRVRNSWGANWGDNGSIWVDYDFFVTNFAAYAFVAQNPNSSSDNPPNPPVSNTKDLLASFAEDYPDPEDKTGNPRKRAFSYQVYNSGAAPILASERWGVYYMCYDAYNANDYTIIFEDYYTDGQGGKLCAKPEDFDNKVCWGKYENTEAIAGGIWNYMNVAPGKFAGEAEAGEGYVFEIPYEMPNITGDYYLLVYADVKDVIKESNENNNFYFIADENGKPLKFVNGVRQPSANQVASAVLGKRARPAPVHSVVDLGELNAYTPEEIKTALNRDKKNGVLAKKIAEYRSSAIPVKRIRRQ